MIKTSCAVSGTGYLVDSSIIKKNHGWKCNLLTEDIEFTVTNILDGEKVGYCEDAMFYDEQPTTFKQSWNQRMRWTKASIRYYLSMAETYSGQCSRKRECSYPAMI